MIILVPEKASEGPELTSNSGAYFVPHQIEIGESIMVYNPQNVSKQLCKTRSLFESREDSNFKRPRSKICL